MRSITAFTLWGIGLVPTLSLAATGTPETTDTTTPDPASPRAWNPSDPIRLGNDSTYMDIGLVGTFAVGGSTADDIQGGTQTGGHDPNQNGFSIQGVELNLSGAVDPYFHGNVNILYSLDAENESFLELEEAWLETLSLPWNLQVRAGQLYTQLGRHNSEHVHSWSFVDTPLVNARFLGPDGLRNPGARLSWLMPVNFFSELSFGIQNSHGESSASFRPGEGDDHGHGTDHGLPFAYRHNDNDRGVNNLDDLLLSAHYGVSFELSETQTVLLGASGAFGPNSSGDAHQDTRTEIYGIDFYWKYRPSHGTGGFPFVAWQTEAMLRRYQAGMFDWAGVEGNDGPLPAEDTLASANGLMPASLNRETLTDYGFYTQLTWGFRRGWVAGLRYDFLTGNQADYEGSGYLIADGIGGGKIAGRDPSRATRWRISPNLTWYPTEYSKIRLQYNFDERSGIGQDHSVWLQLEFALGAHAAHTF